MADLTQSKALQDLFEKLAALDRTPPTPAQTSEWPLSECSQDYDEVTISEVRIKRASPKALLCMWRAPERMYEVWVPRSQILDKSQIEPDETHDGPITRTGAYLVVKGWWAKQAIEELLT